jgi:ABC transport system ATP-binding/permease protein
MPLVSLDGVSLAFGHLPLLDTASFQVEHGERVAVLGRNGTGKSTLLQVLAGEIAPDGGAVRRQPGIMVGRLAQDVPPASSRPVFDVVAEGLGDLCDLVTSYHRAAQAAADGEPSRAELDELGALQHELDQRDGWRIEQRVEHVLTRLHLPASAPVETLSGGWRRRAFLARALVGEPGLLLLDEPTNHLDIAAIEWLERTLATYPGAVVFVTHDRAFLRRLATRIVELDRGALTSWPGDYAAYLQRREERLAAEAVSDGKIDKRLATEEAWLRRGVKARRTRDEGRVRALLALRAERAARREAPGEVRFGMEASAGAGRMVVEAQHVGKSFGRHAVVRDFSARIMRGDRIGIIGPNGAGKTTLLRLLLQELPADTGEVRHGSNVQVAYYDQQRERLDPGQSVFDAVADGRDTVTVNGRDVHVHRYLAEFLFPPERARSPVSALSGGERNRLLFARLFARPANLLVLDEPTNDLDLETLELLEEAIAAWTGTLLVVSHDRAFLDNVVTSTFVLEGEGRVAEYVGGYDDWLRQRGDGPERQGPLRAREAPRAEPRAGTRAPRADKLSYRERLELEQLPQRIGALEAEAARLSAASEAPEFYREPPAAITATLDRIDEVRRQMDELYVRWDELDSRPG